MEADTTLYTVASRPEGFIQHCFSYTDVTIYWHIERRQGAWGLFTQDEGMQLVRRLVDEEPTMEHVIQPAPDPLPKSLLKEERQLTWLEEPPEGVRGFVDLDAATREGSYRDGKVWGVCSLPVDVIARLEQHGDVAERIEALLELEEKVVGAAEHVPLDLLPGKRYL